MHELSICQALVRQVGDLAKRHGVSKVAKIIVRVGPLSGIEPSLLTRVYPLAAAGGVAEDAELVVETLPVRIRCLECDAQSEVGANRLLCAQCGAYRTELVSGDEMLLARLEFDSDAA